MKRDYRFDVNGFSVTASYEDRTVDGLFLPLLRRWTQMYRERGERIFVFLSAPPGVGKTTVAQFLAYLSRAVTGLEPLAAVGLDGFHYHADYIAAHSVQMGGVEVPMKQVKGAPETYDIPKLTSTLRTLRMREVIWPVYDRNLHDVVEEGIRVDANIVLVEGNWMLSSEGMWADVAEMCDDSIFIEAEPGQVRDRLIARKIRGGLTPEAAEAFYERSDRVNVLRLMEKHVRASFCWRMLADGEFVSVD